MNELSFLNVTSDIGHWTVLGIDLKKSGVAEKGRGGGGVRGSCKILIWPNKIPCGHRKKIRSYWATLISHTWYNDKGSIVFEVYWPTEIYRWNFFDKISLRCHKEVLKREERIASLQEELLHLLIFPFFCTFSCLISQWCLARCAKTPEKYILELVKNL